MKNRFSKSIYKTRHQNHVAEDTSIRIFLRVLPEAWILRMMTPDYGIDMEIEVVELDSSIDVEGNVEPVTSAGLTVTGLIVWLQMKSTYDLKRRDGRIFYDLETSLLRYVSGCQIPIILLIVDLKCKEVFWVHLQKYIRDSAKQQSFEWWTNSTTVRIEIPETALISDSSSDAFDKWKRIASESCLIREVARMQANLFRSRVILRKLAGAEPIQKKMLLEDLINYLSGIYCSGYLFFDPSFKEGWDARNQLVDPLIDYLDLALKSGGHIDIQKVYCELENLADFAANLSENLD